MANTTRFNIEIPDVGADADAWGTILNNYLNGLEALVTDKRGDTINGNLSVTGSLSGNINASSLTSGTVPDARFPATLPAVSGANLTNLNAGNLATGTVPTARLSGTYDIVADDRIQPVAAAVSANALTVTLNPTATSFRSTTLNSGASTFQAIANPLTLTVPSGATLGTINAIASRLVVLAIYTGTAVELAIVNIAGGNQLDETNLISTVQITAGSDSANVIYSATARTNVPYRVMGFVDSTQATAGTWASAPSLVQGAGGQALAALSSLGFGQTWQNVTAQRAIGTTYYNTTGKPIQVAVVVQGGATNDYVSFVINGTVSIDNGQTYTGGGIVSVAPYVIPAGSAYRLVNTSGISSLRQWFELR